MSPSIFFYNKVIRDKFSFIFDEFEIANISLVYFDFFLTEIVSMNSFFYVRFPYGNYLDHFLQNTKGRLIRSNT